MEGAEVVVSLSLVHALSEIHPLSETPARLASKRNLGENLPRQHALSGSPAHPTRFLPLLALSVPGSLSQN